MSGSSLRKSQMFLTSEPALTGLDLEADTIDATTYNNDKPSRKQLTEHCRNGFKGRKISKKHIPIFWPHCVNVTLT